MRPTLASTAFSIVDKIIRSDTIRLLTSPESYCVARASYFGGVTQVFSKDNIYSSDIVTERIEYIDINSLYPSVMA